MSEASQAARGRAFDPRIVGLIIAIAVMAFGALLALLAWGPDIQSRDQPGGHAYSSSALGYGGLVKLLELDGHTVNISRTRQTIDQHNGLLILTPGTTRNQLDNHLPLTGPILVILPKWTGTVEQTKPSWLEQMMPVSTSGAEGVLKFFDEDADVTRIEPPNLLRTPYGHFKPHFEEKMQIIKSDMLETVIKVPTGALLSKLPDSEVYFLADPDLANTFGLSRPTNALLMLNILRQAGLELGAPVTFDVTLNGMARSTSLLRIMLDIPFLGATLTFLAGLLLLGWSACVRFGAPTREVPAIALGKLALADNTAGLFSMTGRETRMAPGYLALSRKAAAKALGTPAQLSETDFAALLDRLGPDEESGLNWTQMAAGLSDPSANREELLNKARRLYRWRKEKTYGHK